MFARIKHSLQRCFLYESAPHKLAASCALAVYISFCPFIGFHTLITIGLGLLLGLNVPLMLAVGNTINNPLTMIPVYMGGYFFGYWILHSWWGLPIFSANPWWMESINTFFQTKLGVANISLWAFLVGGNVLGALLGVICYVAILPVFVRFALQRKAS